MKKSQRARLAALTAKDAATLSADEKSELATLQALAVANPDASKDVEDAVAAAAAPAGTPTLGSVIKGALASLGDKTKLGADLAQARADLALRTTERDTARTEIAALTSQVGTFAAFFGLKPAELAGKDSAALGAILAQKISEAAIEQLAGAGVPAAQLPKATQAGSEKKTQLTLAEWRALDVHGRAQFFRDGGKLTD